jgi:CO dehydrogenase maturation factor
MKLGIVGKGGVGKTSVSALLAEAFAERGLRVVAVDTDSNPNLGISLGLSKEETEAVPVLPRSLLVGAGGAQPSDLMRLYGRETPAGVTLLSAIKVTEAGAGCTCGGHATVRNLLGTTLDDAADVTLVDMEAGIEHLSRSGGTLAHVDVLVVLVEATLKALVTAERTKQLAAELGIATVVALANKVRDLEEQAAIEQHCQDLDLELVGTVPFDPDIAGADRAGLRLAPGAGLPARKAVAQAANRLMGLLASA